MEPTLDTVQFCRSLISEALASDDVLSYLKEKDKEMERAEHDAKPEMVKTVLAAHKSLCCVKNMGPKEAFGHDPAVFYGLALSGECGELANKLIRVIRVGGSKEEKRKAVESEIADVLIYAILLAYTNDIDPNEVVAEKSGVVVERARSGYYGGPLHKEMPGDSWSTPEKSSLPKQSDQFGAPFEGCPLTGTVCSVCGEPQRRTFGGDVCKNRHGGAPPKD